MSHRAPTLRLSLGPHERDGVQGVASKLEDDEGRRQTFWFPLLDANNYGVALRTAASDWAELRARGHEDEPKLWQALLGEAVRCFSFLFKGASPLLVKWIDNALPGTELLVEDNTSLLDFPWGLLCTPSDAGRARVAPTQPLLWAAKYNLRIRPQYGQSSQARNDSWSFEAFVCKPTYAFDMERLPEESAALARTIYERSRDPQLSVLPEAVAPNCFVYIYAHSQIEGSKLLFKRPTGGRDIDRLPHELFESVVPIEKDVAVFLVLNACESVITGKSIAGCILQQQTRNVEVAWIAAEFAVDRRFAIQFGLELIDRCAQRAESVVSAMKVMRRNHYPMSINYSLFCMADMVTDHPLDVFDARYLDAYRTSIEGVNLSNTRRVARGA